MSAARDTPKRPSATSVTDEQAIRQAIELTYRYSDKVRAEKALARLLAKIARLERKCVSCL